MKQSLFTIPVPVDDGLLLFNTLNTALIHLSKQEEFLYKKIIGNNVLEIDKAAAVLRDQLSQLGIIVNKKVDEFFLLTQKYWDFRHSSRFIKAVVAPTTKCNLRCSYCFEKGAYQSDMTMETCDLILKLIQDRLTEKKTRGLSLIWYGGEPLLSWNIIKTFTNNLLLFCKDRHIEFNSSIVTNGVLLDAKKYLL